MKINHDCIRDVLIYLEVNLKIQSDGYTPHIMSSDLPMAPELSAYSQEDVLYSVQKLLEEGMISGIDFRSMSGYKWGINNITVEGHDFLAAIRNDTVWHKVQTKAASVGGALTLDLIKQIALAAFRALVLGP